MTCAADDDALARLYYGTAQPQAHGRRLTAGAWSALLIDGALRDIRYAGVEVIRSIAYVVRDRDWGTCQPSMHGVEIDERAGSFRIAYAADCSNPDGERVSYTVEIDARADGALVFRSRATAHAAFLTARCGFCVLHPIDGVAGAPAEVEHSDGTLEHGAFPETIDPWQPFKDIRTIAHTLPSGLIMRCSLDGDVFEMEDQRNWSDASFKTYSRPLALPWPYTLAAGSTFDQSVRLDVQRVSERAQRPRPAAEPASGDVIVEIDDGSPTGRMFALGIAVAPGETAAVLSALPRLAELAPQQLTLHFDPTAGHGASELRGFAQLQRACGIPSVLECALPGIDQPSRELDAIAAQIDAAQLTLAGVVVSPAVHRQSNPPGSVSPPCPSLDEVYRAARRAFAGLRIGGGMLSYFTELNRKRPPLELVDWVTHATCPIVHAADDRSVMETLETIAHITRSCRSMIGTQPYSIGPVSIGMRQNPYGSRVMPNPHGERIAMAADDPRGRGLFGAAWLAGYAAALDGADLECLTLGALVGARGLIDASDDLLRYPAFHVAAALARMAADRRLRCRVSRPREIACVGAITHDGRMRIMIANLTAEPRTLRFTPPRTRQRDGLRVAVIDECSAKRAQSRDVRPEHDFDAALPLTLRPYACVQIASGETPFGHAG